MKKQTKRYIKIITLIILLFICAIRIYYVNSEKLYPINKYYKGNEEVEIGNDFFDSSSEKMNGYSIKVLGTELIPIDDFCEKNNIEEKENFEFYDYMYLVKVNIKNNAKSKNENRGINLSQFMITNKAFMTLCDRTAYKYVNDKPDMIFALREGTNMDFIIPFAISQYYIDIEKFKKGSPQLIISLYPTRKAILL